MVRDGDVDRAQYLIYCNRTHKELAKEVDCSTKTIQRWCDREPVQKHRDICKALDVHEDFFESLDEFIKAYEIAWGELQNACPTFFVRLRQLAELDDEAETCEVLQKILDDFNGDHRGALILQPALSELDTLITTEEQLNAIEKFVGFLFLALVDPDHQLVVNVDSSKLLRLGGVTREYVARMLVHLAHAKRMGPIEIPLNNGEIVDSPYTATFHATEAAEKTDEEGVEEFVSGLRSGVNLKEYALSLSPTAANQQKTLVGTSTNVYKGLDAEIKQHNFTKKSRLAIAHQSTSDTLANTIKMRLPNLRVFKYDRGTCRNFLKCGEHEVDALVRVSSDHIQQRRKQLSNFQGETEMAKNVTNIEINAPSQVNTGKKSQGNMQINYNESLSEARDLLRKVASELFLEGQEDLAREAKAIAQESNQESFLKRAQQLVENADVYLGASANIATLTPILATLIGMGAG